MYQLHNFYWQYCNFITRWGQQVQKHHSVMYTYLYCWLEDIINKSKYVHVIFTRRRCIPQLLQLIGRSLNRVQESRTGYTLGGLTLPRNKTILNWGEKCIDSLGEIVSYREEQGDTPLQIINPSDLTIWLLNT